MKFPIPVIFLAAQLSAVAAPGYEAIAPIFEKNCISCHNAKKDKGDFRLDNLSLDFTDEYAAQHWDEVMFRMNAGEMPPEEKDPLTPEDLSKVSEWITASLAEGRAARLAKRGSVEHYRLSREEYAYTVYDLLGVNFDVKVPGALNEDPRYHGFERIGSMLSLSPSHVDRYFKAADTVLSRAFPKALEKSTTYKADAIELRHRGYRKLVEELGIADKIRTLIFPSGAIPALNGWWPISRQQSGIYRARIQVSGLPGPDGRAPHLSIWDPQLKRSLFNEDIIAPEDKPIVIEIETFLDMPANLEIRNEVPRVFNPTGNHTFNVIDHGDIGFFTNSKDSSMINPTGYKLFDDDGKALYPLLIVDSIEWEGPIVSEAVLAKREGLLPKPEGEMTEARASLKLLAERAWRRPVTDPELNPYLAIIESELAAGEKFPEAFHTAMLGILSSINFYYLQEGSPTERRNHLTDWEIAQRLSYFLWSSLPDETLFTAARDGKLRTPDGLREQFRRMIADPKASRFTESFPRQWLQLHNVGMFPPDPGLYPEYDLWLEKSMILESTGYFAEVFNNNLPLREFLTSDWTVVNPRLASFYKLPRLEKSGFQKVKLTPENHRGGLLTQASVLMLTSDGTRHRPVHRGVWVSETIFGKTPPPPPPNINPIEPIPDDKPKATIRMQLESHATDPTCASCHDKIDPLGFAFENYNAIGQWRTEEIIPRGLGPNLPVNATGKLPGGRRFATPAEFKQHLAGDTPRFAHAFVKQLATYALRRMTTVDDEPALKAITAVSAKDGYRLQTLIETFVLSDLFQTR